VNVCVYMTENERKTGGEGEGGGTDRRRGKTGVRDREAQAAAG